MKCSCSNSSVGVFIGVLNVLVHVVLAIFSICYIVDIDAVDKKHELAQYRAIFVVLLVLCLIMTVISGILIMGIVKRRHKLMLPWLILYAIGYVLNCCRFSFNFFAAIFGGAPFSVIAMIFFLALASIGLSTLILYFMYHLYREIRKENIEKPGQIVGGAEIEYKTQENV